MIEKKDIFAERLKQLRKEKNLTQMSFCNVINCTQATLSAYENGYKTPSADTLIKISTTYDISVDWLLGLSNKKNSSKINSISDIISFLFELNNATKITIFDTEIKPELKEYPMDKQLEISLCGINIRESIYFHNDDINSFIIEWKKMIRLHEDKTIDDELFNFWKEKTLKKFDKPIDRYREFDFDYLLDSFNKKDTD